MHPSLLIDGENLVISYMKEFDNYFKGGLHRGREKNCNQFLS